MTNKEFEEQKTPEQEPTPFDYGNPSEMEEDMRKENEDLPYCDKAR